VRILTILVVGLLGTLVTPVSAGAAPRRPSGCGTRVSAGNRTLALRVGDRTRTVIVHVPTGYTSSRPTALVLNLHGSGSSAKTQEAFSGMDSTADADGFLVAYPQAALPAGSGFDWNVPREPLVGGARVPRSAADDEAFLTGLVGILRQRYCVDPAHVDATGFSGGARLASQLGCDAASTFAAIAPVSGLRFPSPCPGTRAVPVIAFHGTADPIDPYGGHGQAYWVASVPDAAKLWAAHDGCGSTVNASVPATGATQTTYNGCRTGSSVQLVSILGEGHEWPGGPALPRRITKVLGPQSRAIDANALMWSFFSAHPLGGRVS
jgi:polyhydroxybutyrate depolymerase